MTRKILPDKRNHITQKAKIGANRTLYLSVDSDEAPNEVFLRVKGTEDAEKVVAYDVIARLISLALQYHVPMSEIGDLLLDTRDNTAGAVRGDDKIKFCSGTFDYIGKHLLVYYGGRPDLCIQPPPPVVE